MNYSPSALRVAEALNAVRDRDGIVWSDDALLALADLDPVSSLGVALNDPSVWAAEMRRQLRRHRQEGTWPSPRYGWDVPDIFRRAEALAHEERAPVVSDRHIAKALTPTTNLAHLGVAVAKLVEVTTARDVSSAGPVEVAVATTGDMRGALGADLDETESLAQSVLQRLESNEPLSKVLPAARRLAEMTRRDAERTWIMLEITGIEGLALAPNEQRTRSDVEAMALFLRNRAMTSLDTRALAAAFMQGQEKVSDGHFQVAPIEAVENIVNASGSVGQLSAQQAINSVLIRVRAQAHVFVSDVLRQLRVDRRAADLLGPDAVAVFSAGGEILAELRNAVESLAKPGLAATAATQARTALLTMGRQLYKGPAQHTSPIDGKTYEVKQEINKLLAFLDGLWAALGDNRKPVMEKAKEDVQTGYELGSKAKNPSAIDSAEAQAAVLATYRVARAICFAGGFPERLLG